MAQQILRHFTFLLFIICSCSYAVRAQIPQVNHPKNQSKRYEVDAKRTGTDVNSNDALPRSREFIRIDSTYYVGWMY
ncbi:MAG: hypothetical protein EOP49_46835, partial [Sphingobacteriales bacterium]